jgi:hypothetical protein
LADAVPVNNGAVMKTAAAATTANVIFFMKVPFLERT